ncbi:hypothetical protein BDV95DRAFT_480258 [Massariosphaeria phaeospora]|uniref:Uncharacterized protein n=1 Tax=Massariosphaeria phaeospora TaxID=100035 RepID=A0A7C8MV45_9PLEO|nr:hypothetical protein BDV95DRAFT_480258 [Massariosphaeria phaeospora]
MNYANMIEEKNLKKTFIIATLCSTLVGTFSSSMGLWDGINKRRQSKRDSRQDDEVKKLREAVEKNTKNREAEAPRRRDRDRERDRDDVGETFERSGAMIQRQYDEGFGRMGRKFAMGDTVTENQLQAQIIALQQTVIQVLQDALYNDRPLSRADMARLVAASTAAREGSIDALRQQQARLALDPAPQRALSLSDAPSRQPPRAPSVALSLSGPPKRASTVLDTTSPLYCRYALALQHAPSKPLAASFAPGGDCRCPDCGLRLGATSADFWQIGKSAHVIIAEGGYEKEVLETREFHLGQRFVLKCHTADGEYACVLCSRYRDVDALCRSVEALVNHVGRFHDVGELERDADLREAVVPLGLPPVAPPAPASSVGRGVREREVEVIEYR